MNLDHLYQPFLKVNFLTVLLGATLTTVLTSQFVLLQHFMEPGKRPARELFVVPFMYGAMVGCALGGYEVMSKSQVIHKPAMARYYEAQMNA